MEKGNSNSTKSDFRIELELINDKNLRHKIGVFGKENVLSNFDLNQKVKDLENFYIKILK